MNKKTQKGIVLITILVFLSVLFVLGFTITGYMGTDYRFAGMQADSLQAFYLARGAIDYAEDEYVAWNFDETEVVEIEKEIKGTGKFTLTATPHSRDKDTNEVASVKVITTGTCVKSTITLAAIIIPGEDPEVYIFSLR
ncbi:MAG: hypothetical protein ABIH00_02690 [Armatimonadota bacterium]